MGGPGSRRPGGAPRRCHQSTPTTAGASLLRLASHPPGPPLADRTRLFARPRISLRWGIHLTGPAQVTALGRLSLSWNLTEQGRLHGYPCRSDSCRRHHTRREGSRRLWRGRIGGRGRGWGHTRRRAAPVRVVAAATAASRAAVVSSVVSVRSGARNRRANASDLRPCPTCGPV
jgi:hypothetical protein